MLLRFALFTLAMIGVLIVPDRNAAPQDRDSRPAASPAAFDVRFFTADLGDIPLQVIERPASTRYVCPYITANAQVACTVPAGERWTVGFIQQVDTFSLRNLYGTGVTSWELPILPYRDAASTNREPWYGSLHEIATVDGGETPTVNVAMDDCLSSYTSWHDPSERHSPHTLSSIERSQSFTTRLIALRHGDGELRVLRAFTWSVSVAIEVDCDQPVGSRCRVTRAQWSGPTHIPTTRPVPSRCLAGASANDAQQFWWTSLDDVTRKRLQ